LLRRDPLLHPGLPPRLLADAADLLARLRRPEKSDAPARLAQAIAWLQQVYACADRQDVDDPWAARLARACALLAKDLAAPADLDAVAAAVGTTALVLRRRFRQRLGCPPLAWRQHQRALRALDLLRTHSLATTAARLGYADPGSLSRQLRRHLGRMII
jgi:transcriptional regulator GlxA family with amidase domain